MPKFKKSFLVIFGRKVLPDRSLLIGQKLMENVKIQMRQFESFLNNVCQQRIEDSGEFLIKSPFPDYCTKPGLRTTKKL